MRGGAEDTAREANFMHETGKPNRRSTLARRKAGWGYFFLIPWLAFFLVFSLYPFFYGIIVSFTNFTLGSMKWVGLENYKQIFADYAFWRSLRGTIYYSLIVVPLGMLLPLLAANALRDHGKFMNNLVKLIFYVPGVVSSVALVIVWKFILAPNSGLLSELLSSFGLKQYSIFDSASTAIPALALMIILSGLGQNLIIYSAAIGGIPETYYEAAALDGATKGQVFRKITVPLLHPTMVYVFITSTIGALQIFVIPQLMTNGGPNYTTSTLLLQVYNSAFGNSQFGYASALGVILFIITAVIALAQFRAMRSDSIEY